MNPIFLALAGGWFIVYTTSAYISWAEARSNRFWKKYHSGDELVDDFPVLTFIFAHLWYAMQISFQLTVKIMKLIDVIDAEKKKIRDIMKKK